MSYGEAAAEAGVSLQNVRAEVAREEGQREWTMERIAEALNTGG